MEYSYDYIVNWMKDYFKAYDKYAQNPKTTDKMHEFYAPDFEIVHYDWEAKTISGRDKFLHLMSSHPSSHEVIVPEDIVVDEKRKVVVVLGKSTVTETKTGKVLASLSYLVHYQLGIDENNKLKIKKIKFFREVTPPGMLGVKEIFMRDAEMAGLFTKPDKS